MIDNIEKIKPLLTFASEDDYYFLQVLLRKKDAKESAFYGGGSNNSSRLIKAYYIKSLNQLEKQYSEIKALCDLFHARACINLNKRSFRSSSLQMMVRLAQSVQSENYANQGMWNNVSGVYHPIKDKRWLIDVDDVGRNQNDMILFIERECKPEGLKYIATIPSKSGYHIITKPFDMSFFRGRYPDIDVHKNNPTNLYIPDLKWYHKEAMDSDRYLSR